MNELIKTWKEFKEGWDLSHSIRNGESSVTRIIPSFTDFMEWLVKNKD